jgi:hypothetical protein
MWAARSFRDSGKPVIFLEIKKPKLDWILRDDEVGWQPIGKAHADPDDQVGRAFLKETHWSGVDKGWLTTGISHETADYAVAGIHRWCRDMDLMNSKRGFRVMVTICSGGADINRDRWWNAGLQHVANATKLTFQVHHFPYGMSRWNPLDGRWVYLITRKWRSFPMIKYAVVVSKVATMASYNPSTVFSRIDTTELETQHDAIKKRLAREGPGVFREQWNYLVKRKR